MSDSILSFSAVLPLRRLIDEARTMSQGDFAQRHVDHYLILEGTRQPEASRLGFRTGIVNAISRNCP